ncbi:MAG TPA: hypothetical protein VMW16_11925 [Sedimentisphaerales bacterium]|nr:hypothetical protein [Sedimentisphaerales bacterium]
MNDIKIAQWHEWNICLQDFGDAGVNLHDVNRIYIAFGDRDNPTPGGSGIVYFDDILLRSQACAAAGSEANLLAERAPRITDLPVPENPWSGPDAETVRAELAAFLKCSNTTPAANPTCPRYITQSRRSWIGGVDDDGPADFSHIQATINAAVRGDTVVVSPVLSG